MNLIRAFHTMAVMKQLNTSPQHNLEKMLL